MAAGLRDVAAGELRGGRRVHTQPTRIGIACEGHQVIAEVYVLHGLRHGGLPDVPLVHRPARDLHRARDHRQGAGAIAADDDGLCCGAVAVHGEVARIGATALEEDLVAGLKAGAHLLQPGYRTPRRGLTGAVVGVATGGGYVVSGRPQEGPQAGGGDQESVTDQVHVQGVLALLNPSPQVTVAMIRRRT